MIPTTPNHIHYIKTEADIGPAINHLLRFDLLGFDTETWNKYDRRVPAFNPIEGARMRLSQWATPEGRVFIFDHFYIKKEYLYRLFPNPFLMVGQNLKFDIKFLMHELGIYEYGEIWDTMIAGQLNARGNVTGADTIPVSLAHLAERELDEYLPKDEQASDWWKSDLSESQLRYAAKDALIVLPIYQKQLNKIRQFEQGKVAEIDFNCTFPVAMMELDGMRLNQDKWLKNCTKNENELFDLSQELWDYFGTKSALFNGVPTININSQDQMIEAFQRKGIPVPIHPREGHLTLGEKFLLSYEKDYPIVKTYRRYKKIAKGLSAFGPDWIDKYVSKVTGRIHADTKIIGAETGRMSRSNPNLLQIPKKDEYRNCFESDLGWVIVAYDYSQMELRILAEYCMDKNFLYAFDMDYDLHRYSASLIFKCLMEAVTAIQRGIAKNLNFGIVYGIGVEKFANDANIPKEEAKSIMDYYLTQAYPGMKIWLDTQARLVLRDPSRMRAYTMTGRIREYYGDLNENGVPAQIQRNAKNFPIQGTSADITKRAAFLIYKALIPHRGKIKMLNIVHDEIILETRLDYTNVAKWILETYMLMAEREYLKRVKSVVDGSVTKCWTKEATPEQEEEIRQLLMEVQQV